jgi:hypothetical protein
MTTIIDTLRTSHFLPFFHVAQRLIPLYPIEVTKLNQIASDLARYDRAPARDGRGEWVFYAIAGELEVWAGEFLFAIGLGKQVSFGFGEISERVTEDVQFISALRGRVPTVPKKVPERVTSGKDGGYQGSGDKVGTGEWDYFERL